MTGPPSFPRWVLYPTFVLILIALTIMVRYNVTAR